MDRETQDFLKKRFYASLAQVLERPEGMSSRRSVQDTSMDLHHHQKA